MEKSEAPEAWIGRLVQVAVVSDERFSGTLEAVNLYGITFRPADDGQPMLLPWASVLWVVLAEEG
ncbi:MAG: hypothetical protein M3494_05805 [Actinomycetota bacterium]|jgi:hypothetical protein|nr:hypothetical protein [Actinomycetota bacterium]MDQ3507514.1 hypothetical protein [Actinomycetota bacterium]